MAERVEITDRESAEAWLKTRDHQTQVWFATRCALRALPSAENRFILSSDGLSLSTCRACLISSAASTCTASELYKLRVPARSAGFKMDIAGSARSAVDSLTTPVSISAAALAWSNGVSEISARDSSEYLNAVGNAERDANYPENWTALWFGGRIPEKIFDDWNSLKKAWEANDADWSFWIEWYEALLEGTWTNWDLIFRIATEVTEEQWNAGPVVVAERIREIEAEFLIEKLPQVNEIYETQEGLYEVRGMILDASKLMQSVLNRVSFALDTAVQSNMCDLNEMTLACRILREALAIGESDANAVEQYLRRASSLIKSGIESGKYAEDDETRFLIDVLDETALQLRGDHPEVADAYSTRLATRLREIDGEARVKTAVLIENMREGTGPVLNTRLELAAEVTRDGSSVEATVDAVKESGNTAGKITVLEQAKRAEGSGQMAMTKMAIRAQQLAEWVLGMISGGG